MEQGEEHIQDGFTYVVDRQRNNTTYLKCKDTRFGHCKGRGKIVGGVFHVTGVEHNHPRDENAELVAIFRNELRQACESRFDGQKQIYDELRILHPEAAIIVTYPTIESAMRRWRKKSQPPIPQTLRDYGALLEDPQWQRMLEYNRGTIQSATLSATDLSVSVVFGDVNFIRQISDATDIFVDATYKVVPAVHGAYQLLTLMAVKYDHILEGNFSYSASYCVNSDIQYNSIENISSIIETPSHVARCFGSLMVDTNLTRVTSFEFGSFFALPFAWALMGRKSKSAYDCVLTYLRTVLAPAMAPTSFMTDFERALHASLKEVFEEATPHGCFFHYCQAVYRKTRSLHLSHYIANNPEAEMVLRKIMALALVPADLIEEAFQTLRGNASADIQHTFAEFFEYYERQWLGRVTPRLFSVYALVRRTNNCIESYHKVLLDKMSPHPNIWDFTKKLMKIQSGAHSDFLALQQGRNVTRSAKLGCVLNHRQILRAWDKLEDHRISTVEFLEQASNFVTNLARTLAHVQPADDRDEVELVEAPVAVHEVAVADDPPNVFEEPVLPVDEDENEAIVVSDEDGDNEPEPEPEPVPDVFPLLILPAANEPEPEPIARDVPPPNIPNDALQYDALCCVCRESQSCVLSLPCFHLVLCGLCANGMLRAAREYEDGENPVFGSIRCPFCNLPATEFRRVNMPQV